MQRPCQHLPRPRSHRVASQAEQRPAKLLLLQSLVRWKGVGSSSAPLPLDQM